MMISVVVCTHNRADYVREVFSVLKQTIAPSHYEVLVIDNDSQDEATCDTMGATSSSGM